MNFYEEMLKEKNDQIEGLKTLIESSTERALNTSNVKKNVSVQLDEGEGILVRLFAVEVEAMLISVDLSIMDDIMDTNNREQGRFLFWMLRAEKGKSCNKFVDGFDVGLRSFTYDFQGLSTR